MFGYFQHEVCRGLERQDFILFADGFCQVIHEHIPTISGLCFLDPPESQPAAPSAENEEKAGLRMAVEKAVAGGTPVLHGDTLLLPFVTESSIVVAQVTGLDEYLVRKVGKDWLEGLSHRLLREFLLVKRASVDSLTGLLSSLALEEYLGRETRQEQGVLLLVSVYPKSSTSFQAKKYQHRTVSQLKRFVNSRFPIYYLGQSCFALICPDRNAAFAAEFAQSLVNYLKRERCHRVHVASTSFGSATVADSLSETVMRRAWSALHLAGKRGPFAFCNYSSIEESARHPLAPPSEDQVRWFRRVSRKIQNCSLLQFEGGGQELPAVILKMAGEDSLCLNAEGGGVFLFLPNQDSSAALKMGQTILHRLSANDLLGAPANCGISSFPCGNFKKSELLLNCRKALLHAAFLEPGSVVVCDAVSYNISGDIYYGDGDLVHAAKEYRRGLLLDPHDGNLLNSLGVCYAQMNRHQAAIGCFRRACDSREDLFMALYNLGLEQQLHSEIVQAIESFTTALALTEAEGEEKSRSDICYQLALLCIEEGRYQEGYDLLLPWYESEKDHGTGMKAVRYLGMACCGIGESRAAMKYLQQALGIDEYDAESLSLLGEMYLKESEGDDIGLRFCEKGVELNPDSPVLQLRLAKAQIQCGDLQAALNNLQPCLQNKKTRPEALLQRGVVACELGKARQAEQWFAKAAAAPGDGVGSEVKKVASRYLKKIVKKDRDNGGRKTKN